MKQIVLGTAGHIDHGKTSLIKSVTGIDTDRLKEEKLRGITIELGFASIHLPSGMQIGIVDVPGHEKFVKNMVAGATGIDIVVMVIAADEGVMLQTREHLEICNLLGIKHGFVALTKIDLVDEEWLELVKEDVAEFTEGTFLENMPVVPVSSATSQGIPEFIKTVEHICQTIPERSATGMFRLPVDRVFTMKGFGTVITGTLISGSVRVGDTVMIYPSMVSSKVRGIQVHNKSVTLAEAGMRTAINFQGLEKASVNRGDVVAGKDELKPSYMIDILFEYLSSNKKPVKNRTRVRFHAGTSEVLGVVVLLDRDELSPGETAAAQIRLELPAALVRDDRFVIRSYSPVRTIGGGTVLNPIPKKHKRFKHEIIEGLRCIAKNTPEKIIEYHMNSSGYRGVLFSDLKIMVNMSEKQLQAVLSNLMSRKTIVCPDKENRVYVHKNSFEKLKNETLKFLEIYHKANPLKSGMPKEELKSKFPATLGQKLFNHIIVQMTKEKKLVSEENTVRLASHAVSLGVDQAELKNNLIEIYQKAALTPPYFKDVIKTLNVGPNRAKDMLMLLIDEGCIVKAKEELYFDAEAVEELKKKLVSFLEANDEITTPQFKEMTGVSRKYLIPLIEHFDSENVTIRVGDIRKLRHS